MSNANESFLEKETICPVCQDTFIRYTIRKRFGLDKYDLDYRPIYLGKSSPRIYAICICPNCFYAAEDKYFCPIISEEELRHKSRLESHFSKWEFDKRAKAASSGQILWMDMQLEKLKTLSEEQAEIMKKISPLLQKVADKLIEKHIPINQLQRDGDLDTAIRSWELAAICYKARRVNDRIIGFTYLNGAWTARDAYNNVDDTEQEQKKKFKDLEIAYLKQAVTYFENTLNVSSFDKVYAADGTPLVRENLPEVKIFEILFILAGACYFLGEYEKSTQYNNQIIAGGRGREKDGIQGLTMWFIREAIDRRGDLKKRPLFGGPSVALGAKKLPLKKLSKAKR